MNAFFSPVDLTGEKTVSLRRRLMLSQTQLIHHMLSEMAVMSKTANPAARSVRSFASGTVAGGKKYVVCVSLVRQAKPGWSI